MPATLQSRVFLYPKVGKFPTQAALLELNADNTVTLTLVDGESGAKDTVVFDESLTDLQIGGAGSSLTFRSANGTWRVDFSPYNAGQRVITVDQANNVYMNRADIGVWVAKLKELGYPSSYRSGQSARLIAAVLIVFGVVVIIILLVAGLGHPLFS